MRGRRSNSTKEKPGKQSPRRGSNRIETTTLDQNKKAFQQEGFLYTVSFRGFVPGKVLAIDHSPWRNKRVAMTSSRIGCERLATAFARARNRCRNRQVVGRHVGNHVASFNRTLVAGKDLRQRASSRRTGGFSGERKQDQVYTHKEVRSESTRNIRIGRCDRNRTPSSVAIEVMSSIGAPQRVDMSEEEDK